MSFLRGAGMAGSAAYVGPLSLRIIGLRALSLSSVNIGPLSVGWFLLDCAVKKIITCLLLFFLACSQTVAATLDFSVFPKGATTDTLNFPGVAVVESTHGSLFVYGTGDFGMPDTGGLCGLQADFTCTGGFSLLFIGPVSNLTFKGYFATSSDGSLISAYSGDALLGRQLVSGGSSGTFVVDFSGLPGIDRIDIASTPTTADNGIAYGDFDFEILPPDTPPPLRVPEEVLSFDSLVGGVNGSTIDIGMAIARTTDGGGIFVYNSGDFSFPENGGLCALAADFRCMGSFTLEFDSTIFDLMFSAFFAKPTDSMIVSLFLKDLRVYSGQFWGNDSGSILFDFRHIGLLDRILIEDRSNPSTKGAAYGDFRYNVAVPPPVPAPVPVPAPFLLLAGALAFLGLGRRSRTFTEGAA